MTNAARLGLGYELVGASYPSPAFSKEAEQSPLHRRMIEATFEQCLNQIPVLETPDGIRPSQDAISAFSKWLPRLFDRALKIGRWAIPHITCSDQGEIVCEWWEGQRKLTIYFGEASEYIKVWGTNIDSEMESGELQNDWNITAVWIWLHSS
ncbi:hypothetical protein [Bradyrhizobium sp. SZCCHNRI2007]|uniref:hypothetical protein n=1 Tax=Bradyrhizobium sp. SZCCHNRI2007 TaxID=3057281 RepID=UPI0028EE84DF|nr:hypothetical protein [Bradyrhizobium sp. SZCCHNRI2007]